MEDAFTDSFQSIMCLLTEVVTLLILKDVPVQAQTPCSKAKIEGLWKSIHEIDPAVQMTDTRKEHLKSRKQLQRFMMHCFVQHHYFFCIKKCGIEGCNICKPPRLPRDVFEKLGFFPDPLKKPASDSYQGFLEVWGKPTRIDHL